MILPAAKIFDEGLMLAQHPCGAPGAALHESMHEALRGL
jgi:hypothetical protein